MSNSDFGLPVTEDADNMPTMAQMSMNFGVSGDDKHTSVRSGVFGGYNHSGTSSGHPSFRGATDLSTRSNMHVQRK